jgi:NifB/MoaA-like Fe-S oxidoreductase
MIMLTRPFPAPLDRLHDWRPGDAVASLDGRRVDDILDLYYYAPEDAAMQLVVRRATGEDVALTLDPGDIDAVTACFAPMEFKTCACDCVFCFIDQNPKGMREQIYVKDEDYRFSFLYGNYITLTSLGKRGLERIIEQRMSPLYVSVHATDIDVRTRMLGIRKRMDIVEVLRQLCAAGIEIHTQVVLCPGWNDGAILEKTFRELLELAAPAEDADDPFTAVSHRGFGYGAAYDVPPEADELADRAAEALDDADMPAGAGGVRSLAVVPVGLSDHREGLTRLDPVTPALAAEVIAQAAVWQDEARARLGYGFIYLSDEFYLLADRPFPPSDSYDGFWQIDNAIGLTARLRETWAEELEWADEDGDHPTLPLTVLTGELAARAWRREFAPVLDRPPLPPVEVRDVRNEFYGHTVTVAGLLSGADLRRALLELPAEPVRTVVLSPRVVNADGLTLDGMTLDDLAAGQPHRVVLGDEDGFIDFWRQLS